MYNSPGPILPLMSSNGFPLEITITVPLTENMMPANFIQFNFSLKTQGDSTVIKIGLVVTMSADRPALMNFSPYSCNGTPLS
jgi:hypothetical protein